MAEYSTLAAVDLGSNSFYGQVARVVGDPLYPLDSLREPVLLAAGLTADKLLDEPAEERTRQTARAYAADAHAHEKLGFSASATRILKTA
jgi:exopolyphosphatase/guanosine-5'-triphosphate,3'-diphosphate pyrophosphatase